MSQTKTQTVVRTRVELDQALRRAQLTAEEENVLRMRYGVPLDPTAPLELRGQAQPEVRAQLALLEKQLLTPTTTDVDEGRRATIIDRLRKL